MQPKAHTHSEGSTGELTTAGNPPTGIRAVPPAGQKLARALLAVAAGLLAAGAARAQDVFVPTDNGVIGIYSLSGSAVNPSFISVGEADTLDGLTVSGSDLFFIDKPSSGVDVVEEYDAYTGALINPNPLNAQFSSAYGLAVSGSDIYVTIPGNLGSPSNIQEYNYVTGTEVQSINPFQDGVSLSNPTAIAISGTTMYVGGTDSALSGGGEIVSYTLSGSFIAVIADDSDVAGLAVSGTILYASADAAQEGTFLTGYDLTPGDIGTQIVSFPITASPFGLVVTGTDLLADNSRGVTEYSTSGTKLSSSIISSGEMGNSIAISPAPEPSSFAMMLLGAGGLLCWHRLRAHRRTSRVAP